MNIKEGLASLFGKNAVRKALIWLLVVAVAALIVVTQFAFPVLTFYKSSTAICYEENGFKANIVSVYERLKNESDEKSNTVAVSDNDFDLSQPQDYLRFQLRFDFWNIGVYNITDIQFDIIPDTEFSDRFIFKEGNVSAVNRFSASEVSLIFVMNKKGLSDEEINRAIASLDISYSFARPELFSSGGRITLPADLLFFDGNVEQVKDI